MTPNKIDPNRVIIFDTTLRDGEQSPGFSMNIKEKLEMAQQLARLGVDVMEAGFPITSPGDFEAVNLIAREVRGPVICGLARTLEKDVRRAGEALEPAARKRIHTFIATSKVHVEKKLRMSREQVIDTATNAIRIAREYTDDVEFSCEDAGRTDWDYIVSVVTAAIQAGATTINIPDTVGFCVPEQFGNCIRYIREHTPGIENVIISVHCHNDLGHAVPNSLAGVIAGARQIECTINGIGERAGNTSLEEAVMMLHVRSDYFGLKTHINSEEIYRTSRLLSRITGIKVQPNKAIVGANAFAHEAGIHQDGMIKDRTTYEIFVPESVGWIGESLVMGKHSGRAALAQRLEQLGYGGLSQENITRAYDRFKALCDAKKEVYDEDLMAIVEDEVLHATATYKLIDLETSIKFGRKPQVRVKIAVAGEEREAQGESGDGPIDALYHALGTIVGHNVEVTDFVMEAVTGGADALGRVKVVLNVDGERVRGIGLATDTIVAAVQAYLAALNRYRVFKDIKATAEPVTREP